MKRVRLTESQLRLVIRQRLNELGGRRGLWKPEWDKEDQMLAMYNALYGIEELGISPKDVAEKIIGTSVESFVQQTANFEFQHTGKGLDRPHDLQTEVYEEFKNMPREEFKDICRQIIDHRTENPPESVTKRQIGKEIGDKRDEMDKERAQRLRMKGRDPNRMKLISSIPAEPTKDDEVEVEKENIKDFVNDFLSRLDTAETKEDIRNLLGDVEFLRDYIGTEMADSEEVETIAEAINLFITKSFPEIKTYNRLK